VVRPLKIGEQPDRAAFEGLQCARVEDEPW
jgi:hypothetical protein